MFGMQERPYVSGLARRADSAVPYAPLAIVIMPLLAPAFGEAAMQLDDSLGAVSMGLIIFNFNL